MAGPNIYLKYWYMALASPKGLKFRVPPGQRHRAKSLLYMARKNSRDEALLGMSVLLSPHDPQEIWIIKTDAEEIR